jgi:hypothetical protein
MKKWQFFPWYIFLFPAFYVAHTYNEYFLLVPVDIVVKYLFLYLGLAGLLFGIGCLFFRNEIKAGVWCIGFFCLFFFYGPAHDTLRHTGLPRFFTSYKFVLGLTSILFIFCSWLLKKRNAPIRLHRYLYVLGIFLIVLELATGVFYWINGKSKVQDLAGNNIPIVTKVSTANQTSPDIFFFVFDEYTSSLALKRYFKFDNSALDSALTKQGFYISTKSQSNYNSTPHSIAACFNMDYFKRELEKVPNDAYSLLQGSYSLKKSLIPRVLAAAGYNIINHGLFDLADQKVNVTPALREYEEKTMYLGTLLGRIQRDVFWNVVVRLPDQTEGFADPQGYINRNKQNYERFLTELNTSTGDHPRFVIGHILLPHRPAYYDQYGNTRKFSMEDFADKNHDSLYLGQVQYANKLISAFAKAVAQKRARPLVLIIEGDHGNRYAEWGRHIREKQFMNLNTYYFSDRNYSALYDSISPVNSFRIVLNKYFGTQLPLLKDSTILLD